MSYMKRIAEDLDEFSKAFGLKHDPIITREYYCRACGKTTTKKKIMLIETEYWECQEPGHKQKLQELLDYKKQCNEIDKIQREHTQELIKLSKTREYD